MKTISVVLLGLGLELCYLGIRRTGADATGAWTGLLITASLFYILACYRGPTHNRGVILGFALVHRSTLADLPPELSDDLYRYRWEAQIQESGGNPYLSRPNDPRWASLYDVPRGRIPAPDVPAGYGPLQTLMQRVAFRFAQTVSADAVTQATWMKLPAVLGDLAVLAMLARQPWLVVYAWCPAAVAEFWWSGHNDGLVLAFAVAAWRWRSFLALGAAIALKWWPVLLVPALFRQRPARRIVAIPAVLALAAIPFVPPDWRELVFNARYMSGYVGGWRNNDSLYTVTLWLAGGREYPAKYASFVMLGLAALWMAWRWSLERAWLGTTAAALLLSSNCHPWYVTWMLPAMAITGPWPPVLLWIGLMPLAYRNLIAWRTFGVWEGSTPERWYIFGPVLALMALYTGKSAWTRARSS